MISLPISVDKLRSLVSVESSDKCIQKLKLGKASGPGGLSAEHLVHAHPALVMPMCAPFRSMILHGFVPDDVGCGLMISLLKDKTGDVNSLNNYRGITLIPTIYKVLSSLC